MPTSAWSLPASSSETGLADRLRQPGPSGRAISDSAVLMPPPPLPSAPTMKKLADHPYMQMAEGSRQKPLATSSGSRDFSKSTSTAPNPSPSAAAPWARATHKRASDEFTMPPPAIPARPASSVSERRSMFEQPPTDAGRAPVRVNPIQHTRNRTSDPFALPVTHRRTSDKQEISEKANNFSQHNTSFAQEKSAPPPSPTLAARYPPQSPTTSSQSRFTAPSPSLPQNSKVPPQSPTMSQAPWSRPQSPGIPPSPRFGTPSVPPSPRPATPSHRHTASFSAIPPPSPRTPGHKVSQSLSELQSLMDMDTPKKPDLPSNPAVWNPAQLAQHLRYSLRSGADGQKLPAPVVEDVVTWIFRHRVDGSGFLAGVEGIGGRSPPFLPVLNIVSRKLRQTSRAERHAALPLPEDMPEQTRVRRLAHAFESASEAEDDLFALRQQLTGNSIEGYGRATPRTTEKVAWHRHRADSVSSNLSDSRWELSPTSKHVPAFTMDELLHSSGGPRLSLTSEGQADDEMEVGSSGIRSPSPESPLISPRRLFQPPVELQRTPGSDDVPPLSPSSALGDITHISNISAVFSPSDLFSPSDSLPRSPSSPAALKKGKRVSSTKRLPSTFAKSKVDDDESRKVTVTPNRRVSRKRSPSFALSPGVDSPLRAPSSAASPLRIPGSPLEALSPLRAEAEPSPLGAAAVDSDSESSADEPSDDEATPEPEVEPPVQATSEGPASLAPPSAPSPSSNRSSPRRRMEREVLALHDRVRELEQRLASVTPSAAGTPIKDVLLHEEEVSYEKETIISHVEPPFAEASIQAIPDSEDAAVATELESEDVAVGTEVTLAVPSASIQCLPGRVGLETSVACQTSPLVPTRALVEIEDEAEISIRQPEVLDDAVEMVRSRSSSMSSTTEVSKPLPKGWWQAFLGQDEAIPPMRDVPVLFFMAGMGVGVSFGAVVVRVMLGRKLLHA